MNDGHNNSNGRDFRTVYGGRGAHSSNEPFDKIADWLRNSFSGGGGGNSSHTKYYILGGIFLFLLAFTSIYTVDVSEEAVVTRFDRYLTTTPPGLHFKLPFGVDRVIKVPSKVLLQEEFGFRSLSKRTGSSTQYEKSGFTDESLMLTGDLNVADVEWIVQYRISDPWKFLFNARNVQKNIRDVSMSIMRRVVGDRLVGDVLTVGRVEIADNAKKLTQEVLDKYDMGINVMAVVLQDVTPPDAVKSAFNDVNAAKQEQEQAINVAEREYNNVIPEAKGKAEQLIANAEAFSISLVNQAKGDASKFNSILTEYKKSPNVTRSRMYVEAMEEVFGSVDRLIIVDSKIKGILPLYPSMDKVIPVPSDGSGSEKK